MHTGFHSRTFLTSLEHCLWGIHLLVICYETTTFLPPYFCGSIVFKTCMYICVCSCLHACWRETVKVDLPVSPLLWDSQKTTFKSWFWPYALLNQGLCSFCFFIVYPQLSFSYPLCAFYLSIEVLEISVLFALPQT